MNEFVQAIFSLPTAVFTAMLGFVLCYWLLVILGAVDLEALDLGGVGEALEGTLDTLESVLDGAAEGAFESAAEGAIEGAASSAAEGAGNAAEVDVDGDTGGSGLLYLLGLTEVPITVSISLLIVLSWFLTLMGMSYLAPMLGAGMLATGLVLAGAMILSLVLTRMAIYPLRPIFKKQPAPERRSFVGKISVITTNRVTEAFGQAEIEDGGAGLLVPVRCLKDNTLGRGDKALVYDYRADEEIYLVAPLEEAMRRGSKWLED